MFSRSGWGVIRNALFAKGGTSKKRLSLHLHNVQTQSNKVSPQTLQIALILCGTDYLQIYVKFKLRLFRKI
jgi:hypothetical protein